LEEIVLLGISQPKSFFFSLRRARMKFLKLGREFGRACPPIAVFDSRFRVYRPKKPRSQIGIQAYAVAMRMLALLLLLFGNSAWGGSDRRHRPGTSIAVNGTVGTITVQLNISGGGLDME
jgi:hypothetical protein